MDSVICIRTVSRCRTALTRAAICKYSMLHYKENAPKLGPNFTSGKMFLPGHGHGWQCGQFDLNEFTPMIVKLYHDEEGDVAEAGKQSDMPTLRMVSIAASAEHRWSRSACMGNRGGGWAMSEFGGGRKTLHM